MCLVTQFASSFQTVKFLTNIRHFVTFLFVVQTEREVGEVETNDNDNLTTTAATSDLLDNKICQDAEANVTVIKKDLESMQTDLTSMMERQ